MAVMSQNLEVVHVSFARQMVGKKAKRQRDENWRSGGATKVFKEAGTQALRAYIDK